MILIIEKAAQRGNATQPKEKQTYLKDTTLHESCQQRLHRQLLASSYMYALGYRKAVNVIEDGKLNNVRTGSIVVMALSFLSKHNPFYAGVANALRELLHTRRLAQCK